MSSAENLPRQLSICVKENNPSENRRNMSDLIDHIYVHTPHQTLIRLR